MQGMCAAVWRLSAFWAARWLLLKVALIAWWFHLPHFFGRPRLGMGGVGFAALLVGFGLANY